MARTGAPPRDGSASRPVDERREPSAPWLIRSSCRSGAANCRAGLKVLCATVGAVLYPDGGDEEFKIKRSKIRGVESLGMLCAEDELGIGASHDGIMELPADAPVGMPAGEYLRIEDDYLIEIGLTPNRVDAASHIGVARDLAAYLTSRGRNREECLNRP